MRSSILVSANLDVRAAGRAAALFDRTAESVADDIAVQGRLGSGAIEGLIVEARFSHLETLLKRLRSTENGRATLVIVAIEGPQDEAAVVPVLGSIDDICFREHLETDLALRFRPGLSPKISATPLVPRRKCLYVDASAIRKTVYVRLLDMYGFEPLTASTVQEALLKIADVETVIVDATLDRAEELPNAAPVPVIALVSGKTAPKGGGFRFAYDRKRAPDELLEVVNELLFGPELPTALSQRRPMTRIARLGAGQDALWGITEKINPAGVFLRTLAPVSVGQRAAFTLWLPKSDATDGPALEEVSAAVRITWRNPLSTHDTRAESAGLGLLFERGVPESLRRFYQTLPKPMTRYGALTPPPGSLAATRMGGATPPPSAASQRLAGLTPPVGTSSRGMTNPGVSGMTNPGVGGMTMPGIGGMTFPGRPGAAPTPPSIPVPGRPVTSPPTPVGGRPLTGPPMPVPGRPRTMTPPPIAAGRPVTPTPVPGRPETQSTRGQTQPGTTPSPRAAIDPAHLPLGHPSVTPAPRARSITPPPSERPAPPSPLTTEVPKPPKKE